MQSKASIRTNRSAHVVEALERQLLRNGKAMKDALSLMAQIRAVTQLSPELSQKLDALVERNECIQTGQEIDFSGLTNRESALVGAFLITVKTEFLIFCHDRGAAEQIIERLTA